MKSKRVLCIIGVLLGALILAVLAAALLLCRKPSVKYLLNMSGMREPGALHMKDAVLSRDAGPLPVRIYLPPGVTPTRNFILFHGFAPQGERHPQLNLMARSICDAAGMRVIIPRVDSYFRKGATLREISDDTREIYLRLVKEYPGRNSAFGACIGATVLLNAMRNVPPGDQPGNLFLFGPLGDGRGLEEMLRKNSMEVDFIV